MLKFTNNPIDKNTQSAISEAKNSPCVEELNIKTENKPKYHATSINNASQTIESTILTIDDEEIIKL